MSTCVSSSLPEPITLVSNMSGANELPPPSPDRKKRPRGNVEENAPPATRPSRTRRDAFHDERNQALTPNLFMPEGFALVRNRSITPSASDVLQNAIFVHCVYGRKAEDRIGGSVALQHSVSDVGSYTDLNLIVEPACDYHYAEKGWHHTAKLRTGNELAIGHSILVYQYGNLQTGSWLYCSRGEVSNVQLAHAESTPCVAYQVLSLNEWDGTFHTGPATDCSIVRLVQ